MANGGRQKKRTGAQKRKRALRWVAFASLALIGVLYYQPLRTYLDTRAELEERSADVQALERERDRLEQRLAATADTATLLRDARKLGWVKPGEQLVIVRNIDAWRRQSLAHTARSDGRD
jgi:hypothetical protein